jgi:hypothetical protein
MESNSTSTRLSVLIVNYNGAAVIRECLASLHAHLGKQDEVIVVDNASADGSAQLIDGEFPWVTLIRSESNLGFTGGNNLAAKHAKGELLLLLNNDAFIESGIGMGVKWFEQPDVGVVGAHLYYPDGRLQPSIGLTHSPLRLVASWLGLRRLSNVSSLFSRTIDDWESYQGPMEHLDWVSGAALMIRRELWDAIGGFDESYFMYMEDVDLCDAVREQGFKIVYEPGFNVTHYEAGGNAWVGQTALLRTVASYKIYLNKHYGLVSGYATRVALSMIFLARVACLSLFSLLGNNKVYREKASAFTKAAFRLLSSGNGYSG